MSGERMNGLEVRERRGFEVLYDDEGDALDELSREEIVQALKMVLDESEGEEEQQKLKGLSDEIGHKNKALEKDLREAEQQVLQECLYLVFYDC